jgi:hypothetical protein
MFASANRRIPIKWFLIQSRSDSVESSNRWEFKSIRFLDKSKSDSRRFKSQNITDILTEEFSNTSIVRRRFHQCRSWWLRFPSGSNKSAHVRLCVAQLKAKTCPRGLHTINASSRRDKPFEKKRNNLPRLQQIPQIDDRLPSALPPSDHECSTLNSDSLRSICVQHISNIQLRMQNVSSTNARATDDQFKMLHAPNKSEGLEWKWIWNGGTTHFLSKTTNGKEVVQFCASRLNRDCCPFLWSRCCVQGVRRMGM